MHRCTLKQLFIQVYCTCSLPESYDSRVIEVSEVVSLQMHGADI